MYGVWYLYLPAEYRIIKRENPLSVLIVFYIVRHDEYFKKGHLEY